MNQSKFNGMSFQGFLDLDCWRRLFQVYLAEHWRRLDPLGDPRTWTAVGWTEGIGFGILYVFFSKVLFPIPSMGLVYLPTFTIQINHFM